MPNPVPVDAAKAAFSIRMCLDKDSSSRPRNCVTLHLSNTSPFVAKESQTDTVLYKIKKGENASRYLLLNAKGEHLAMVAYSTIGESKIYTYLPNSEKQKPERRIKGESHQDIYFLGQVQCNEYALVRPSGSDDLWPVAMVDSYKRDDLSNDRFVITMTTKQTGFVRVAVAAWPKRVEGQDKRPPTELKVAAGMDLATAFLLYHIGFYLKHRQTVADDARDAAGVAAVVCFCEIL